MFDPLYPAEGAPCRGFYCRICERLTRTRRGMISHLWKRHQLKLQAELPFDSVRKTDEIPAKVVGD